MTNEEMATRIKQGETELMPQLWAQVERFIRMKAKGYFNAVYAKYGNTRGTELKDLIQQGYLALISAIDYFDENLGYKFLTMLNLRLKWAFTTVMGLRTPKDRKEILNDAASLNVPVFEDDKEELLNRIVDETTDDDGSIESTVIDSLYIQQLHDALERGIDILTDLQKEVIIGRYYNGLTCDQLATKRNCTRANINSLEYGALDSLYRDRKRSGLNQFIEDRTDYYLRVTPTKFNTTETSAVEALVLHREKLAQHWINVEIEKERERQKTEKNDLSPPTQLFEHSTLSNRVCLIPLYTPFAHEFFWKVSTKGSEKPSVNVK